MVSNRCRKKSMADSSGIGTFDVPDGDMITLDSKGYQAREDGLV
jgi:alpha-acetolactate decarboxylase